MESPFDVLQVDPDAEEGEIERAFRRRVLETHPDQGGSSAEFKRVKAAYEEISAGDAAAEAELEGDGRADGDTAADRAGADGRGRDPADEERRGGAGGEDDGTRDGGDRGGSPDDGETDETATRVEYLNYEVIVERGWSLDDENLFEKASAADLDPDDRGRFLARPGESLLEAAENRGFAWPYACRGGACANCAIAVTDGEVSMPADHILPPEFLDRGIRLSCNGVPATDEMQVVFNVEQWPDLEDLLLPPNRFEQARSDD
jgi:ferredoxin